MPQNSIKTAPPLLSGLKDIVDDFDYFILDIWGVLHDGQRPFPHTLETLQTLKSQGKHILLLSNTPILYTVIAEMLADMGITHKLYDHILTAGDSTRHELTARQDQKCWCAGHLHDPSMVAGLNIEYVDHPAQADYMINAIFGNDEHINNHYIDLMRIAAERRLDMICPNPDKVVHVGAHLKLCPGTFAEIYETEMDGTVHYHGKPHRTIYDWAHEKLGRPDKERMVAIGDSLHTDMQGANNFGITGILNMDGIHREEFGIVQTQGGRPDESSIAKVLGQSPHQPDMLMNGFAL